MWSPRGGCSKGGSSSSCCGKGLAVEREVAAKKSCGVVRSSIDMSCSSKRPGAAEACEAASCCSPSLLQEEQQHKRAEAALQQLQQPLLMQAEKQQQQQRTGVGDSPCCCAVEEGCPRMMLDLLQPHAAAGQQLHGGILAASSTRSCGVQTEIPTREYVGPRARASQAPEHFKHGWLHRPKTVATLCFFLGVAFVAARVVAASPVQTLKRRIVWGCFAGLGMFLVFATVQLPDGLLVRPFPVVWRFVKGCSVLYLVLLVFLLFQDLDDVRGALRYIDPSLGRPLPEKNYAHNCHKLTTLWESMDVFVLAHFFGWIVKALIIRDARLLWILSILFEWMEISLRHILPNFWECWWDHLILDVFGCNLLGLYAGLALCRFFSMKEYRWQEGRLSRLCAASRLRHSAAAGGRSALPSPAAAQPTAAPKHSSPKKVGLASCSGRAATIAAAVADCHGFCAAAAASAPATAAAPAAAPAAARAACSHPGGGDFVFALPQAAVTQPSLAGRPTSAGSVDEYSKSCNFLKAAAAADGGYTPTTQGPALAAIVTAVAAAAATGKKAASEEGEDSATVQSTAAVEMPETLAAAECPGGGGSYSPVHAQQHAAADSSSLSRRRGAAVGEGEDVLRRRRRCRSVSPSLFLCQQENTPRMMNAQNEPPAAAAAAPAVATAAPAVTAAAVQSPAVAADPETATVLLHAASGSSWSIAGGESAAAAAGFAAAAAGASGDGRDNTAAIDWSPRLASVCCSLSDSLRLFAPYEWTGYYWPRLLSTASTFVSLLLFCVACTLLDLNVFFLKAELWIPPSHWLILARLVLCAFMAAAGTREYYEFVTDPNCSRMGVQCWIDLAVVSSEALLCVQWFHGLQPYDPCPTWIIRSWTVLILALIGICLWLIFFPREKWKPDRQKDY